MGDATDLTDEGGVEVIDFSFLRSLSAITTRRPPRDRRSLSRRSVARGESVLGAMFGPHRKQRQEVAGGGVDPTSGLKARRETNEGGPFVSDGSGSSNGEVSMMDFPWLKSHQ
jgi:hypothetical protein